MQEETLMPGKRGRQPGQKIDSRALSGTIGTSHLQRMIGSLVRAMDQPELSAQMRLKLCRQITELRADIARCKIEAERRKADALLAEPPTVSPNLRLYRTFPRIGRTKRLSSAGCLPRGKTLFLTPNLFLIASLGGDSCC